MTNFLPRACLLKVAFLGLIFCSTKIYSYGQTSGNLIANSSFDSQIAAPYTISNVKRALIGGAGDVNDWACPSVTTPDYLATNAPSNSVAHPSSNQLSGAFTPHNYDPSSYNGTLGLLTYQITYDPNYQSYVYGNEYINQKLPAPLTGGKKYFASYWALLASNSQNATALGMAVTATDPYDKTLSFPPTYPAVSSGINTVSPVTTRNWTRVSGIFTAETNAQYVNIGYLVPSTGAVSYPVSGAGTPSTAGGRQTFSGTTAAYYYIDDVELYAVPTAGNNATINCNSSVTLGEGPNIPGATYAWSINGQQGVFATTLQTQVSPAYTTTYTLTVTLPGGSVSTSSVTVTINPPTAGPAQNICTGQSATIGSCPFPGATYTWTAPGVTGLPVNSSTLQITVSPTAPTAYTLTVTLPNGTTYTSSTSVSPGVGVGPTPGPIRGDYNAPPGRIRATISAVQGATSYDWYVNGVLQSTHGVSILFPLSGMSDCDTPEIVDMQAVFGSCGVSYMVQRYFYPICQEGRASSASTTDMGTTAYPNPASESIMIPAGAAGATLLNDKGKIIRHADASGKFDVQSLPDGLYNLQMMQNGKLINQRIQVKH